MLDQLVPFLVIYILFFVFDDAFRINGKLIYFGLINWMSFID